ncbi:MAG: sulfite exporter TauE/SafE family protein [Dongiaceae bacterium]
MHDLLLETLGSLSPWAMVYAVVVVFMGGVLRGYTGFGFALAVVPLLSLILSPAEIVPAVVAIGIPAGLLLVGKIARIADWRSTIMLALGAIPGLPIGVLALANLSADVMRAIIGLIVLIAVFLLWRGFRFAAPPPRRARLGLGFLSGMINGATAMGGPPVIIYYLALPGEVAIGRASILVFFFFLSIATTTSAGIAGLLTPRVLVWAALMLPCFFIGSWLGDRGFDKTGAGTYRRIAMIALALVAVVAIARAVVGLVDV